MAKINPKLMKNIFTEDVVESLPANDKIKTGVGMAKRSDNYHSNPDAIEKRKRKNADIIDTVEWKENHAKGIKQLQQNEQWKERNKVANQEKWKNPETKEKHLNAIKKRAQDPVWQENVKKANQAKPNDPVYMNALHKGIEKRSQGDWYKKNARKNVLTKSKPIVTPYGIFPSRIVAVKTLTDVTNIGGKINNGIKEKDSGYYYITQEEYIMLTGKEI